MATYLDAAGPTGAPAAVVNPESGLPATWRVRSTWEHGGRRGAWVEGNSPAFAGTLAQIVYDDAEPVRKASNLGATLGYAASLLYCRSLIGTYHDHSTSGRIERQQRATYYAERGIDIEARDLDEWLRYRQAGKPGPNDPYTPIPPLASPTLANDRTLQGLIQHDGLDEVRRTFELKVHPDAAWPRDLRRVTIDGRDWAYESHVGYDWDHFVPIAVTTDGKVYSERGLSVAVANKRNRMGNREYSLRSGTAGSRSAVVQAPPAALPRRATPPPAAALERAQWLGEQITMMASAEENTYAPHTRRRIAAHRALAMVNGYEPASPENDGLALYGTLSLHLAGLNEMARRAFDGENGDTDALL